VNPYLAFILAALALSWLLNATAAAANIRALTPEIPEEFRDVYDAPAYAKTALYLKASARLDLAQSTFDALVLCVFILAGGFGVLDLAVRSFKLPPLPAGLLYLGALLVGSDLLSTPFDLFRTFVIEERFGFNRTTARTWLTDKLKGYALGATIGGPLVAAILLFFQRFGVEAWLYAWAAAALVLVLVQYLAPALILPLFNRFTPLEEGELKTALSGFAARQGFNLDGIFVVDGSRRTSKANAFFTGFGKKKRISLFDTLLEKMGNPEILAVLAHEVGHYRKRHALSGLALGVAQTGLLLFLFSLFLSTPALYAACGVGEMSVYAGLALFALLYQPVALVLALAVNALSRRHEYQADAFAAETTSDPESMVSALTALSAANAANLTPHPLYVALHYSHPPVLARIRALRRQA
jgi:STE24 endopeptidase